MAEKLAKPAPAVSRVGIDPAEARLRHLLFTGRQPARAARSCGLATRRAQQVLQEMLAADCGPRSEGPYTVTQAAVVLGLKLRRTRTLCEEGRIGRKHGARLYLITREDLERFGAKPRRSGHPGADAVQKQELQQC